MKKDLLSVIIPVYNVEKYLNRCIKSVVEQAYNNMEIILVDDGSTDKSSQLCDEWGKKDSRIKVMHKKNGGLSDARNAGIDIAEGQYIAFVDSDDKIAPEMYKTMISAMKKNKCQISTCGRYYVKNSKFEEKYTLEKPVVLSQKEAIKEFLLGGILEESACDKVYESSIFTDIRFPFGEINEDLPIMPNIISRAERIVCIGQPYYYYYCTPNGITQSKYSDKNTVCLKHINIVSDFIEKKYPDMKKELCVFRGRASLGFIFPLLHDNTLKKKYNKLYSAYFNNIRQNKFELLKSSYLDLKHKIIILLIVCHIYKPLWSIVQKVKKIYN